MPLVIVDLMIYLCCGYHARSEIPNQISKAVKLLIERVPNLHSKTPKLMSVGSLRAGGSTPSLKSKINPLEQLLQKEVFGHLRSMVPPLKSYPEIIESDNSIDSDDPRVEHIKADLHTRTAEVVFMI
jgi:hypothetical protein